MFCLASFSLCTASADIEFLKTAKEEYRKGLYRESGNHLTQAAEKLKGLNDHLSYAKVIILLARNKTIMGDPRAAIELINSEILDQQFFAFLTAADRIDAYEIIGKAYFNLSDVGIGRPYIENAISIANKKYGESDARCGNLYRYLSTYFQFNRMYDSAFYYASKAYNICRNDSAHINEVPYEEVLIDFGNSFKTLPLFFSNNIKKGLDSAVAIFRSAVMVAHQKYPYGSWQEASALHQIGNTHTDKICPPNKSNRAEHDSAIFYYKKDLLLKLKLLGDINTETAITFYTLALVEYYFKRDDEDKVFLNYYSQAIASICPYFDATSVFNLPSIDNCIDPYFLSTLLGMKGVHIKNIYLKKKDIRYLKLFHDLQSLRIEIWDRLILNFKSADSNRLIALWNNDYFGDHIWSCYTLFEIDKDTKYKEEAFLSFEKSKNSLLVKRILQSGALKNKLDEDKQRLARYRSYTAHQVAAMLSDSTALIEYTSGFYDAASSLYACVLTKESLDIFVIHKSDSLEQDISKLSDISALPNPKEYNIVSNKLYCKLLKPLIKNLSPRINNFIIVPEAEVATIPFEVLTDTIGNYQSFGELPYIIKKYSIHYTLSGTISEINAKNEILESRLLCIVPEYKFLSTLPFSQKYSKKLSISYDGDFFLGNSIDLVKLKKQNYGIVHIAAHSKSNTVNSDSSFICLGDNPKERTYLKDIYRQCLSANLTIISACESGLGQKSYGEGTINFSRAFFYAGSRNTITTLWQVDDYATTSILSDFYNNLEKHETMEEALRSAKLEFLNSNSRSELAHPFYWAGLTFTGNGGSIELKKKEHKPIGIQILLLSILSTTLIVYKLRKGKPKTTKT